MNSRLSYAGWVIFHVPHDSKRIPGEVRNQFVLDDVELEAELCRMTDHDTLELFTSLIPADQVVCAPVSRLVVDVERIEDDAEEPMAERGMGGHLTGLHRVLVSFGGQSPTKKGEYCLNAIIILIISV